MTGLLDQVMELPTLPAFVAALDARFAAEQERRRKFYAEIPDAAKREFINGEDIMHAPDIVRHMFVRRDGAYALELKSGSGWVRSQSLRPGPRGTAS